MAQKRKKIVYVGGGSLYFESVTSELATTEGLPPLDIVFYDIDKARNDVMSLVGNRIIDITKADIKITKTTNKEKALEGADFAIASVGVHGPRRKWHLIDSHICADFGIITTTGDTVGPSGLSQGLRLIPIMVDLAKTMEKLCPDCVVLNHSNPMSPVVRAIQKYSSINVIGYCHNTAAAHRLCARALGVEKEELDLRVAGVNHMVWLLDILHKGKSVYPLLTKKLNAMSLKDLGPNRFARDVFNITGLFPIGGDRHIIEFFPHARATKSTKRPHYNLKWRANMINENLVEAELNESPKNIMKKASGEVDVWIPKEGETSPEAMGKQVRALMYGPENAHFVITRNSGAVPNLPDWAALELKAVIGQGGARSITIGDMPPVAARWTAAQIYGHELLIEAAIEGSRQKALQALASDPMIRDFHEAVDILDALVKAHGSRLRQFKKKAADLA